MNLAIDGGTGSTGSFIRNGPRYGDDSPIRSDLLGREVAVPVDEPKQAGSYEIPFDGSGPANRVYFYRLTTGSHIQTRKRIIVNVDSVCHISFRLWVLAMRGRNRGGTLL